MKKNAKKSFDPEKCLKIIVGEIKTYTTNHSTEEHDSTIYLRSLDLFKATISPETIVGISNKARRSFSELVAYLHKTDENYKRKIQYKSLYDAAFKAIIEEFIDTPPSTITFKEVSQLASDVSKIVAARIEKIDHVLPCSITPHRSNAFSIGPVMFEYIADFYKRETENSSEFSRSSIDEFTKYAAQYHANWIASVTIDGAEEIRSSEIANIAVDIAISALQMTIDLSSSRLMSRTNGLAPTAYEITLSSASGHRTHGIRNFQPGVTIAPDSLSPFIQKTQAFFDCIGRRISSLINLNVQNTLLERSWCDATYWFHEALSEPIDTIAITKLETSMEVLLGAGKTSGSTSRLREAFRTFLNKNKNDPLTPDSTITTGEFCEDLVEARSRILHGTHSTLVNESRVDRDDITSMARIFLIMYAIELDEYYKTSPADSNDIKKFLEWINSKRIAATPSP